MSGTAKNVVDYQRIAGSALIPAGKSSVDITIKPIPDTVADPDKTVVLRLSANPIYDIGKPYFGTVTISDAPANPPIARLTAAPLTAAGGTFYSFQVKYTDDGAMDRSSVASGNLNVTGPNGYAQNAQLVATVLSQNKKAILATYRIPAPGGLWDPSDNGTYVVLMVANQVKDAAGNAVVAGGIGDIQVNVA